MPNRNNDVHEIRLAVSAPALEVRNALGEGDALPTLVGYAALFNSPTEIAGAFREQISPGAFAEAIAVDDVRALIDHEPGRIIGRNKSGTLRLSEDDRGLRVEIDPPSTTAARDLVESIGRGDVSQMSFAFRATGEEWQDADDDGAELPLRTITRAKLYDVSAVTYPAYPTTNIGLRSLELFRKSEESEPGVPPTVRKFRMGATLRLRGNPGAKV